MKLLVSFDYADILTDNNNNNNKHSSSLRKVIIDIDTAESSCYCQDGQRFSSSPARDCAEMTDLSAPAKV